MLKARMNNKQLFNQISMPMPGGTYCAGWLVMQLNG
jgi:hypothetical protein